MEALKKKKKTCSHPYTECNRHKNEDKDFIPSEFYFSFINFTSKNTVKLGNRFLLCILELTKGGERLSCDPRSLLAI